MADDGVIFDLKGWKELQQQFEALDAAVVKDGTRAALRAGGKVILDSVVAAAPERSGFMKKHFNMKVKIKQFAGSVFIGPAGKIDYPLDAEGTYEKKTNRKGRTYKVGRIAVATVVYFFEYGTRKMGKKPFMTAAAHSQEDSAIGAVINSLKATLAKFSGKP